MTGSEPLCFAPVSYQFPAIPSRQNPRQTCEVRFYGSIAFDLRVSIGEEMKRTLNVLLRQYQESNGIASGRCLRKGCTAALNRAGYCDDCTQDALNSLTVEVHRRLSRGEE